MKKAGAKSSKEIEIIYQDDNILVINKPSGLMVHGDGRSCERTLADILIEERLVPEDVGEPLEIPQKKDTVVACHQPSHIYEDGKLIILRPGIVHRLDKDTSGVLVIARDQKTFLELKNQFQERTVKKEYLALVRGAFKENIGSIAVAIGRSKNDFRKWHSGRGPRGELREAITDYRVVSSKKDEKGTDWSLIKVFPRTGRTHQIRVHMRYANHPVAGDSLYGETASLKKFPRLMLHASSLSFIHPKTKEKAVFQAPTPKEFEL